MNNVELIEHEINCKSDTFIGGWFLDDITVCDVLIDYHTNNKSVYEGRSYTDGELSIDKRFKNSLDCYIDFDLISGSNYRNQLQMVLEAYIEKYPFCNWYAPFDISHGTIQKYNPGGGFYVYHTERGSNKEPIASRHLVFMTYLNDVTHQGETEFYHQKLKIKPKKGLTLIWPADWTHTHRGIASPSQTKYIATGWYNFAQ